MCIWVHKKNGCIWLYIWYLYCIDWVLLIMNWWFGLFCILGLSFRLHSSVLVYLTWSIIDYPCSITCRYVMLDCNDIFKYYSNRMNKYSEFYVSIILFVCFDCVWWCISSRIKLISMLIIDCTYYSINSKNLKEKEGWNQDRWNSRWNWNWIL